MPDAGDSPEGQPGRPAGGPWASIGHDDAWWRGKPAGRHAAAGDDEPFGYADPPAAEFVGGLPDPPAPFGALGGASRPEPFSYGGQPSFSAPAEEPGVAGGMAAGATTEDAGPDPVGLPVAERPGHAEHPGPAAFRPELRTTPDSLPEVVRTPEAEPPRPAPEAIGAAEAELPDSLPEVVRAPEVEPVTVLPVEPVTVRTPEPVPLVEPVPELEADDAPPEAAVHADEPRPADEPHAADEPRPADEPHAAEEAHSNEDSHVAEEVHASEEARADAGPGRHDRTEERSTEAAVQPEPPATPAPVAPPPDVPPPAADAEPLGPDPAGTEPPGERRAPVPAWATGVGRGSSPAPEDDRQPAVARQPGPAGIRAPAPAARPARVRATASVPAPTPAGDDEPFWVPVEDVPRDMAAWPAPRMGAGRRGATSRGPTPRARTVQRGRPRRPAPALAALVVLALLAAFFGWVSAEPLWLAVGHGDRGSATVTRCTGSGVAQRCAGEFTTVDGARSTRVVLHGVAAEQGREGAVLTARMVDPDSRRAYVEVHGLGLHLRWGLGLLLVLLCGAGIAWATGATRLESPRARRRAVLLSLAGPLLLALGFFAASW